MSETFFEGTDGARTQATQFCRSADHEDRRGVQITGGDLNGRSQYVVMSVPVAVELARAILARFEPEVPELSRRPLKPPPGWTVEGGPRSTGGGTA